MQNKIHIKQDHAGIKKYIRQFMKTIRKLRRKNQDKEQASHSHSDEKHLSMLAILQT